MSNYNPSNHNHLAGCDSVAFYAKHNGQRLPKDAEPDSPLSTDHFVGKQWRANAPTSQISSPVIASAVYFEEGKRLADQLDRQAQVPQVLEGCDSDQIGLIGLETLRKHEQDKLLPLNAVRSQPVETWTKPAAVVIQSKSIEATPAKKPRKIITNEPNMSFKPPELDLILSEESKRLYGDSSVATFLAVRLSDPLAKKALISYIRHVAAFFDHLGGTEEFWSVLVPWIALRDEMILNIMLAAGALFMFQSSPHSYPIAIAEEYFRIGTLQLVDRLQNRTTSNMEACLLAATLINCCNYTDATRKPKDLTQVAEGILTSVEMLSSDAFVIAQSPPNGLLRSCVSVNFTVALTIALRTEDPLEWELASQIGDFVVEDLGINGLPTQRSWCKRIAYILSQLTCLDHGNRNHDEEWPRFREILDEWRASVPDCFYAFAVYDTPSSCFPVCMMTDAISLTSHLAFHGAWILLLEHRTLPGFAVGDDYEKLQYHCKQIISAMIHNKGRHSIMGWILHSWAYRIACVHLRGFKERQESIAKLQQIVQNADRAVEHKETLRYIVREWEKKQWRYGKFDPLVLNPWAQEICYGVKLPVFE